MICILAFVFWIASAFMNGWESNHSWGWTSLVFWLVTFSVICYLCVPLKQVAIDHEFLYVSNYIKETSVPLADIDLVTENLYLAPHRVTIHFNSQSAFGRRITFMPKQRFLGWHTSHPIVDELEDLIAARRQVAIVAEFKAMKS